MKMHENVKNTAGKKEKSGFSEFITVLICCLLFGMICGYFCADSSFQFSLDLDTVYFLGNLSVCSMGTVNLICTARCFGKINKAGSLIRSWDGEDDELPAKAESLLAVPMTVSSVVFIFNMMMIVDATNSTKDMAEVDKGIVELGNKLGMRITMQQEDIFNAMHRI